LLLITGYFNVKNLIQMLSNFSLCKIWNWLSIAHSLQSLKIFTYSFSYSASQFSWWLR